MSEKRPFVPKTPVDFQKLKLDKLMANPDKPVIIPDTPRGKKGFTVPEFVRNVMGSSAGAGSGEFHVYRHLRRKEYTRQKMIEEKAGTEKLDAEFQQKLEDNKRKREEKIAKNRAKRLKKKERKKQLAKKQKKLDKVESEESSSGSESDENLDEHLDNEQSSANDFEQVVEHNTSNVEKDSVIDTA